MRSTRQTRTTYPGVIVAPWGKPVKTQNENDEIDTPNKDDSPWGDRGALWQSREVSERENDEIDTPNQDDSPWGDRGALGQNA